MNSTDLRSLRMVPPRAWARWLHAAFLLCALSLAAGPARADLKWQATRVEFHPAVSDQDVTGRFPFINQGADAVVIDALEPGCGCTTASLDKLTYQPGETGTVQATFHIGERTGFQDKVIRVRIHGLKDPVVLTMATFIPDLLKIEPRYVYWRLGDPPAPRSIKLTVLPDARLAHLHVISTNPRFKAAIQTLREGSDYMLIVTPADTSAGLSCVFAIEGVAQAGPPDAPLIPKRFQAFANIVPR